MSFEAAIALNDPALLSLPETPPDWLVNCKCGAVAPTPKVNQGRLWEMVCYECADSDADDEGRSVMSAVYEMENTRPEVVTAWNRNRAEERLERLGARSDRAQKLADEKDRDPQAHRDAGKALRALADAYDDWARVCETDKALAREGTAP